MGSAKAFGIIIGLASLALYPMKAEASLEPMVFTFDASPNVSVANLVLVFPVGIDMSSAKIEIIDGQRKRVAIDHLQQGSSDIEVNVLLKHALSPGVYTVRWRAISAEGKPVKGSYKFNVDP